MHVGTFRGDGNVRDLDWGVSYLGVYNCQNSSNSTTKICEISMYVNYILKKKLYIKKRQVLLLQASQKERKWGQLKEAAGAQTPARRGHR